MTRSTFTDGPWCYKEEAAPDLSKMTWEELRELARTEYQCPHTSSHYSRKVTEHAILSCHQEYAKHYWEYVGQWKPGGKEKFKAALKELGELGYKWEHKDEQQ